MVLTMRFTFMVACTCCVLIVGCRRQDRSTPAADAAATVNANDARAAKPVAVEKRRVGAAERGPGCPPGTESEMG